MTISTNGMAASVLISVNFLRFNARANTKVVALHVSAKSMFMLPEILIAFGRIMNGVQTTIPSAYQHALSLPSKIVASDSRRALPLK